MKASVTKTIQDTLFLLALVFMTALWLTPLAAQSVELTWDSNTESTLDGYFVYRSNLPSSGFFRLNSFRLTNPSFLDEDVQPGSTYYYRVTAVSTSGEESDPSNVVSVTLEDAPANALPLASDDQFSAMEDQTSLFDVAANDSDPDADPLTVAGYTSASHGTVTISSDNRLRYQPFQDYYGSDSFTYRIHDGRGGESTARVDVTVQPVNDRPTAVNDSAQVDEDDEVRVFLVGNDLDPDGDSLVLALINPALHGSVLARNNSVIYTPDPDFNGNDRFGYVVQDPSGATASGLVEVEVRPVNDAPQVDAGPDLTAAARTELTLEATAQDVDDDPLTYHWTQLEGRNTKVFGEQQSQITVRLPNAKSTEELVFQVTVSDGQEEASDLVTITVVPQSKHLIFPAAAQLGPALNEDPFVGIAIVNPKPVPDQVRITGLSSEGQETGNLEAPSLNPLGQTALSSSDLAGLQGSAALRAEAETGSIQGFFMIGDSQLSMLDGVGGQLTADTNLYFPLARHGEQERTSIFLFNPDEAESPEALICLHEASGAVLAQAEIQIPPLGTYAAPLDQLFQQVPQGNGYLTVQSNHPLQGFELFGRGQSLASLPAQRTQKVSRLLAPHFFLEGAQGGTELRLLNPGQTDVEGLLSAYDDGGRLLAQAQVAVAAGAAYLCGLRQLLGLAQESLSGYFEIDFSSNPGGQAEIIGSITFSANQQRVLASLPLVSAPLHEQLFLHVAQSEYLSLFTGMAIVNPGQEEASIVIQAFDGQGNLTARRDLRLPAAARLVDLLDSKPLFGPAFQQVGGHLRIASDQPVVAFTLFGDTQGEMLAAIEGQAPLASAVQP